MIKKIKEQRSKIKQIKIYILTNEIWNKTEVLKIQ